MVKQQDNLGPNIEIGDATNPVDTINTDNANGAVLKVV
jgi:hypothetical protein